MPPLEVELEVGGQDAVLHHRDHLVVLLLGQVAQDLVVVQDHHALVEVVLLKDRRRVQLRQRVLGLGLREKNRFVIKSFTTRCFSSHLKFVVGASVVEVMAQTGDHHRQHLGIRGYLNSS